MKRRDAFKSMIALAVAPAILKVEMLMPVKAIVSPIDWSNVVSMTHRMLLRAKAKMELNGIPGPYTMYVHPSLYQELVEYQDYQNLLYSDTIGINGEIGEWGGGFKIISEGKNG